MPPRHHLRPLPRLWLMTDERMGEGLWGALANLPRGSGVVFRHHATAPAERRRLFARIAAVAQRRRLVLIRAGTLPMRGEQGVHGRRARRGLTTWPVHDAREAKAARRAGADLVFVSPVFATRSHPGAGPLGVTKAARLARIAGRPAIALGGMDARSFRRLRGMGFHGWAAIDAWLAPDQKRKAVPR